MSCSLLISVYAGMEVTICDLHCFFICFSCACASADPACGVSGTFNLLQLDDVRRPVEKVGQEQAEEPMPVHAGIPVLDLNRNQRHIVISQNLLVVKLLDPGCKGALRL